MSMGYLPFKHHFELAYALVSPCWPVERVKDSHLVKGSEQESNSLYA